MKKRNNKGFTLIELFIVIAIIGILTAIILPQITRFNSEELPSIDVVTQEEELQQTIEEDKDDEELEEEEDEVLKPL